MSKTIRLIRENDPSTYAVQEVLFGVVPNDESRERVIEKLESFYPDYYSRLHHSGEIPVLKPGSDEFIDQKGATHPAFKGFDLAVHAVAQLTKTGEEVPLTFKIEEYVEQLDAEPELTISEVPYPFFFAEDSSNSLSTDPMFNGFMYGINVLKRTRPIVIPEKNKVKASYDFDKPEIVAEGSAGFLVAQCLVVDCENGAFIDFESHVPTHYGKYAPSNLRKLVTFSVLNDSETRKYVSSQASCLEVS